MDVADSTKRCSKCGETKPVSEFNRRSDSKAVVYRSHCKACVRAQYQANRAAVLRRQKAYQERNQARERERTRLWKEANPERAIQLCRQHYRKNREQYYANNRRRRARERGADGQHTAEDVRRIHAQQKDRCYWCDVKLGGVYHIDHIVPLSRGGSDNPANLCCACASCNCSKKAKMPWEFSDRLF